MAATFKWYQYTGTDAGTGTDLGSGGNNAFNFKNHDSSDPANYTTYPITAGNNSFEVWLKGNWTDTFNKIDNLQFWMSTNFSPATGLTVKWKGNNQTAGVTPVATESTVATADVPTSDPGTANVSIGGSLSGELTSAGYSDFIVLQLQTTTDAAAGDTSLATFTLQYDEQ